jgi:hypothetical protein
VNAEHSRYEQIKKFTILPRDFTMADDEVTPTLKLKRRVAQDHFAARSTRSTATDVHAHGASLNRVAFSATLHCLTGCAIGEILGLAIGTALGWGNLETIVLAIVLAFFFGYSFTVVPLLRSGLAFGAAAGIALAADTISITVMEIVDNAVVLLIPGAMDAGLDELLFWASLAFALAVAFVAAYPVNRWLIARGRGHAVAHSHH